MTSLQLGPEDIGATWVAEAWAEEWPEEWPGPDEAENALQWLSNIGQGMATGAATGAVAGPWGALVGGLVGGGLGAAQTALAQQQQPAQPRPAPAPTAPPRQPPSRPAPRPVVVQPARPPVAAPRPAPPPAAPRPAEPVTSVLSLLNDLAPLLVAVTQQLQAAQAVPAGEGLQEVGSHDAGLEPYDAGQAAQADEPTVVDGPEQWPSEPGSGELPADDHRETYDEAEGAEGECWPAETAWLEEEQP